MGSTVYVQPGHRELFGRLDLSDFDSVMTLRSGMVVGRHKHRDTSLILLGEGPSSTRLFLKRVYRSPIKHVLEDLLAGRRPHAQPLKEWKAIERCQDRGIEVMRPVAWGQRSVLGIPRQAFLLILAVPAPESLDEAVRRLTQSSTEPRIGYERRRLAQELGAFVGRIHRARLIWPDMVAKHIFVSAMSTTDTSNRWSFFLIDVERMDSGGSPRARGKDLRALLRSLRTHPLRATDLLRFAHGYVNSMGVRGGWHAVRPLMEREFAWAGRLISESWVSRRQGVPMPDDAVPYHRERFFRVRRITVNEAFIPILQDSGLVNFGSVFRPDVGERLDKANIGSWRQRLRVELTELGGKQRTLYVKRYETPPLGEQLRRMFLCRPVHSAAWWEWRNIGRVAAAGVPTLTPVALGEKMRGIFERRSFVVTEAIPGESLERWVPAHLGPGGDVDWRERRRLVEGLAFLVRTLHGARLIHRDLYLSHIFISHNRDGRAVFRLIDLQRVFRPVLRWRRWQVKDLSALDYSTPIRCVPTTERIRFMRHYLGVSRLRPQDRSLIRRIVARTRRITRRDRKR